MKRREFLRMFGTLTLGQALGMFGSEIFLPGCKKSLPTTPGTPPKTDADLYDWFDLTVVDGMTDAPIPGAKVDLAQFDVIQDMACCGTTYEQAVVPYGQTDGEGKIRIYISRGPEGVPCLWPRNQGTWTPPHKHWYNRGPGALAVRISAPGYFVTLQFVLAFAVDPKLPKVYANIIRNYDNERIWNELFYKRVDLIGVPDNGVPLNIHDPAYVRVIPKDVILNGDEVFRRFLMGIQPGGHSAGQPFGWSDGFLHDNPRLIPGFNPRRDIKVYTQARNPSRKEEMAHAVSELLRVSNQGAGYYESITIQPHPLPFGEVNKNDPSMRPPNDEGISIVFLDRGHSEVITHNGDELFIWRDTGGVCESLKGVMEPTYPDNCRLYYGKDYDPKIAAQSAMRWLGIALNFRYPSNPQDRFRPDRPDWYRTSSRLWMYVLGDSSGFDYNRTTVDYRNGRHDVEQDAFGCHAIDTDLSY